VLCAAETAVAHEETYPSRADAYGPELAGFIDSGIQATSLDVARANICRNHWRGTLSRLFQRVDMLIAPAIPFATPPESTIRKLAAEDEGLEKLTRYTAPFDFSGSPTISVPCGLGAENVPFGFQLIGRDLDEGLLLRGAHTYQQHTNWHKIHPNL